MSALIALVKLQKGEGSIILSDFFRTLEVQNKTNKTRFIQENGEKPSRTVMWLNVHTYVRIDINIHTKMKTCSDLVKVPHIFGGLKYTNYYFFKYKKT